MSLLSETIKTLETNGRSPKNVRWVGKSDGSYVGTWKDFEERAMFDYDSGWGSNEIPLDLVVVGRDFWLERHEYDGSEWWEFKKLPLKKIKAKSLPNKPFRLVDYTFNWEG